MRLQTILMAGVAFLLGFSSCKTTEENYRKAYETAISARTEDNRDIESGIYGDVRKQMDTRIVRSSDGTEVEVRGQLVRVTKDGGGVAESLRRFNVVVGQFKQRFNAVSLRNRLADGSYPGAFVVETSEPYYFVVAKSFTNIDDAESYLKDVKAHPGITMKDPLPFILDATFSKRNK